MINTNNVPEVNLYTKVYHQFSGVDFTTDDTNISDSRSPDSLNLIADAAGFPEKRVGWRTIYDYSCDHETRHINNLYYANFDGCKVVLVHASTLLYAYNPTTKENTIICLSVHDGPSAFFTHGGYVYFLDGATFNRIGYIPDQFSFIQVSGIAYAPTTAINGHYEQATEIKTEKDEDGNETETEIVTYSWVPCQEYEEQNILTSKQINTLAGDGVNKVFWLSDSKCTVSRVELLKDGKWTVATGYKVAEDAEQGKTKLTFTTAPAAHAKGAGIDNIKVHFTTTNYMADPTLIEHCTIATQYGYFNDNRFFVSGNPDKKHMDWACAVDDPTYWEVNQWTQVGGDSTAIKGYLHYGDVLAIVKEDDNQDAEIYIRSAEVTEDNKVLYPVQQGIKGVGSIAVNAFASLRDDPLFLAKEGVFAIAGTDASQQRTVQNRSYYVDNKLTAEKRMQDACCAVWQGRYILAFPESQHCYVADSRMRSSHNESFVYEWFFWDNIPANHFLELDGELYFGTEDGRLCKFNTDLTTMIRFNDNMVEVDTNGARESDKYTGGDAIRASWITKADTFGTIARTKTLTKKGCTAMLKPYAHSSITMGFETEKEKIVDVREVSVSVWDFAELDFSRIDFNGINAPQVVAFKRKVKKFASLQLSFENAQKDEAFGLYRIDVQYYIGNYIK